MQTAPAIDLSTIPAARRAAVIALMETVAVLTEITRRQEHLIAELNHARQGKRLEKLFEDERLLAFEDLSIALAEVEAEMETRAVKAGDGAAKPAPKRTFGNLPAGLPRMEKVIEPANLICPCGCGVVHKIGEDRSERLDIVPAQLRVIVTVRPKYACRTCTDGVTQAPAPSHLIMGGLPTEAAIAHVLVSKYADHLPLYRQSQILARAGLDLYRAVLADGVGKAAFHLRPIVDRMAEHLKRASKLFMDETTAPMLDPARGVTKTGYLWALARDDRPWGGEDPPGFVSPFGGADPSYRRQPQATGTFWNGAYQPGPVGVSVRRARVISRAFSGSWRSNGPRDRKTSSDLPRTLSHLCLGRSGLYRYR